MEKFLFLTWNKRNRGNRNQISCKHQMNFSIPSFSNSCYKHRLCLSNEIPGCLYGTAHSLIFLLAACVLFALLWLFGRSSRSIHSFNTQEYGKLWKLLLRCWRQWKLSRVIREIFLDALYSVNAQHIVFYFQACYLQNCSSGKYCSLQYVTINGALGEHG